jgi:hypothetical protein
MAASGTQGQLTPKIDLLQPKTDPNDILRRIEDLERQVAELKRRGQ